MKGRNDILKSAFNLFCLSGYRNVTLNDIANEAGVQQKQLKSIFSSKRNIFLTMFDAECKSSQKKLENVFKQEKINREVAADSFRKVFQYTANSKFLEMIYKFNDFPVEYYLLRNNLDDGETLIGKNTLLENYIEKCKASGIIRDDDTRAIADSFRNLVFLFLQDKRYLRNSKKTDSLLIDIFIEGLLIQK